MLPTAGENKASLLFRRLREPPARGAPERWRKMADDYELRMQRLKEMEKQLEGEDQKRKERARLREMHEKRRKQLLADLQSSDDTPKVGCTCYCIFATNGGRNRYRQGKAVLPDL